MSDACKHRSGRKTPPSYSFPSLGSRERASRHALVLPGPGPTKGTEDGSCFTREGELHGARLHRAGAPTIAIGVCKSELGACPPAHTHGGHVRGLLLLYKRQETHLTALPHRRSARDAQQTPAHTQ